MFMLLYHPIKLLSGNSIRSLGLFYTSFDYWKKTVNDKLLYFEDTRSNPKYIYLELSPTLLSVAYSQESIFRTAALAY